METTKDNIHKAKDSIDRFKEKRAEKALDFYTRNDYNKYYGCKNMEEEYE